MANLIPNLRQGFVDENGEPLAGGKIYTYAAGTSTPLATYTDHTGDTENTNPIILDANGDADIWIGQDAYKFVITNAEDVELKTIDGVVSVDNGSITTAKLADGSVTTIKIADGNVTTAKLADSSVTTPKIANLNVTTAKINNAAVTTEKLADESVTAAKFNDDIYSSVFTERNKIINGDMNISQRDVSFVGVASGDYTLDHWRFIKSGSMAYTIQQSGLTVPSQAQADYTFRYAMQVTCTTPSGALAATDVTQITQSIEGTFCRDIIKKEFVCSFWMRANKAFKFTVAFANSNFTSSLVPPTKTYVADAEVTAVDTWQKIVIPVPAATDGTWASNTNPGLTVAIVLSSGTTYQTTPGAWQNGKYAGSANMDNFSDTASNQFYITGVRLEGGSIPRQYESMDPDRELMLCMRYYEIFDAYFYGYNPNVSAVDAIGGILPYRVSKPALGSIAYSSTPFYTKTANAAAFATALGVLFNADFTASGAGSAFFSMVAHAESEIDLS